MKRSLHAILCCPVCKGDLTLAVTQENDDEILEGTLTCASCRVSYPIEDGIPDLIPRNADAGCVD
ncbi:uncharacterized protein YbaR (Trm112 family) [Methanolinea mesophila]|uniref:methytransferase partner Trm112 n=1 Tax=Methanolinea mesophila TaxID=547055 RepID=UPI001AE4582D|nr:methytransferase partner Trm112 [Methanolinea mesophila]MBP1928809.1 uncharacterized protein YbaR (Trm112 family) [Methanolinea mesophila]